jgi:hypothetical protein
MIPDTGADTPTIVIAVSSALPPVASVADRARSDHAGFDQRTDHDEKAGEEQQRLPLDAGEVVGAFQPGDHDQHAGTQQCHRGRFHVQCRMGDERAEHQRQHHAALDQQPPVADGFALLQRHHVGDPLGVDVE